MAGKWQCLSVLENIEKLSSVKNPMYKWNNNKNNLEEAL
jgi:hypothetical protein